MVAYTSTAATEQSKSSTPVQQPPASVTETWAHGVSSPDVMQGFTPAATEHLQLCLLQAAPARPLPAAPARAPPAATELLELPPPPTAPARPPRQLAPARSSPDVTSLGESRHFRRPATLPWLNNDESPAVHKKDLAWLIDSRIVQALVDLSRVFHKLEVFDEKQKEVD